MKGACQLVMTASAEFAATALEEIEQAMPGTEVLAELDPGVYWIALPGPWELLSEAWQAHPPVFVRHICPVDDTAPAAGADDDICTLVDHVARFYGAMDPMHTFSVQTRIFGTASYRPYHINQALAEAIQYHTGATLDVRQPEQIVSVVIATALPGRSGVGLIGLSTPEENLSDWAGGMRRFARERGQISRSEFKLLEAMEIFRITLPMHGMALDLGAAPGGWTRILRQLGLYVTAVDTADLDPRLRGDRGIRYRRMTAQAYLKSGPDTYDVIFNDMRMDARDSARLMVEFAPYLHPDGLALITLKLPGRRAKETLQHALNILAEAYEIAGVRQLFHNRREVTALLRPKRGQETPAARDERR